MRKQFLTFATVALTATLFAQNPPIQNGGFETWTGKAPDSWATVESAANDAGLGSVLGSTTFTTKETATGEFTEGVQAASIQNAEVNIPMAGARVIPGSLVYGKIKVDIATQSFNPVGTIFNGLPDSVKFDYKYDPQGTDSATFFLSLSAAGAQLGGITKNYSAVSSWQNETIAIDYDPASAGQTPDTLLISFLAGGFTSTIGSKLWVDDVRLVYNTPSTPSGIVELPVSTPSVKVYPNPVVNTLNLLLNEVGENTVISIYSLDGKQTLSKELNGNSVNVTELAAGRYLFTLSNANKVTGVGNFNVIK